jgi:hypothetical protein
VPKILDSFERRENKKEDKNTWMQRNMKRGRFMCMMGR